MTNASVNNVVTNPVLLTPTKEAMLSYGKSRNNSTATDFSRVLNRQSEEQQVQNNATVNQNEMKNPSKQENSFDSKTDYNDDKIVEDKEVSNEAATLEKETTTEQTLENQVIGGKAEQAIEETTEVDEETMEVVAEALMSLFQETAEILGVSEDELLTLMEENEVQELDLFYPDTMVKLALAAEGEDSVIGIVMNEDIYHNLQELMTELDEQLDWLTEETELPEEELKTVFAQLKELEAGENSPQELFIETEQEGLPVIMKTMEEGTEQPKQVKSQELVQSEEMVNEAELMKTEIKEVKSQHQEQSHEQSMQRGQQQNLFQMLQENLQKLQEVEETAGMTIDTAPDAESIMKQLTDFIKVQTGKEITEMELQLHPASLGTVNIQLTTKGGVVTAQLTAENETVKHAIETQIADLRSNLEEQGVKVEAIEVTVSSHQMEKNLEKDRKDRQEKENSNKMEGVKKTRRASINLNDWMNQEDTEEEMTSDDLEATKLTREMMAINGGTMDVLA